MDIDQARDSFRLLAVQTSSVATSEVRVLHTLLENLQRLPHNKDVTVEVLLLQGVDPRAGSEAGWGAASLFRQIPNVTVHEISAGKLGQHDTGALDRVMKVRDVANLWFARRELVARARSFQPDLVYSNQQLWDLRLATPLARTLACAQVIHLHYIVGPWLGRGTIDALRQADMVIAVSEFIRDDAIDKGVQTDRVHALYNSIVVPEELAPAERRAVKESLCAELSISEDALLVGMTARLNPHKGQEEVVRAMLPVLIHDRRIHVILAGSENPVGAGVPERIMESARRHGVLGQVHLLGQRSDVPRILDALDVFAHPSRHDPCPLAVLEAAAHGLPIVAWREGGIAKLVLDQETGLLVEPMDIEGLTHALRLLISDESLRTSMGKKARARAQSTFRPEVAADSFLSLLRTAAQRKPAAAGLLEAPGVVGGEARVR